VVDAGEDAGEQSQRGGALDEVVVDVETGDHRRLGGERADALSVAGVRHAAVRQPLAQRGGVVGGVDPVDVVRQDEYVRSVGV